ncbi:TPA: sulfurtransferase complex subunit TusC [Haemophilus influenzae]|jgi:sulfur relay protein TusC/DsrF|uniref:Intracellular sulfur oxidation protein DsrF n=1 Tax=Haemophilus influenzae TaxID=727 RepID=A0A2S9S7M9_HAEIF|nr:MULTISPECIES: sulfurtransferase complex subunit TusC [Haemophilus]AIT67064.1 sulfur relay protein TusC [Haemophilus influenzae]AJO88654.1 tRNA 2-thiouridine synthesizing protein C [Haemophilus influenzae]AJO91542.1 tRNA 2-thiouridine synthesizing protein C [Haemophilus influenzae]AXP39254.1 sulfurtransferase complex subunit TusC [Haemophilus influenzae]AXP45442.1 sulfurtransferase complex subunit TusC [Haemophilus influenzae]
MKIAFLFRTSPHGTSISREGLDAILAATAFCEPNDIGIFFINDGVLNLIDNQQPEIIQQKDFIRTFKLLDLYDVEQRFICTASLQKFKLDNRELILSCEKINRSLLLEKLNQAEKLFTF